MKRFLILFLIVLTACAPKGVWPQATQTAGFVDDFNSFNMANWKSGYVWGANDNNMGNTNAANISAASDADGTTYLRMKSPAVNNAGAIVSVNQFGYGTFAARIRFTAARGQWPAFWQLNDPNSLEWDTLELLGNNPSLYYMTTHVGGKQTGQGAYSYTGSLANQWHVYSVVWTPTGVTFYFDGSAKFSQPYTGAMYAQNVMFGMGIMCNMVPAWNNNTCDATTFASMPALDVDWFTWTPDGSVPTPTTASPTSTFTPTPTSTIAPTRTPIPTTTPKCFAGNPGRICYWSTP